MTIKQLFENNADEKWTFIAPGGNEGDYMIYAGARKLADQARLNYTEMILKRETPAPEVDVGNLIYVQGGGGWCTWWNWTPRLVSRLAKKFPKKNIIVGPSTVAKQDKYIYKWLPRRRKKKLLFYAREQTTYDYMKDKDVTLRRDHDTALALEKGDKWLTPLLEGEPLKPFRLAAIRDDPESPKVLPKSIDLDDYDLVVDPCLAPNWASLHVYATEILTNRSHSAILGAILGKKTKMFQGSYHKNKSIWESSLRQRGVKWVGT